ncbi:MAG TPA: hypothetical protein VK249_17230 [Anaerolineales bacterium]|nr:hypothetical protein [Anaerolineales bacterium]
MIPQIYIMAAVTLVISLAFWGGLIYLFTGHQKRYFWLLVLGLPLSAIANLILKRQAIVLVGQAFHVPPGLGLASPAWFLAFGVLITPLVEEPIKVLPLLLRQAWKMVTSQTSALWVGFVLGVSFGLGEELFLAYAIAQNPAYASLPWYAYTGYFNERLLACFAHGVLTAKVVIGIEQRGRYISYAFLAALGLHLFLNAPIALYQFRLISFELYNVTLLIPFIVFAIIFERMRWGTREPKDDLTGNEVVYWQRQDGS